MNERRKRAIRDKEQRKEKGNVPASFLPSSVDTVL